MDANQSEAKLQSSAPMMESMAMKNGCKVMHTAGDDQLDKAVCSKA